jgi:hypothetical protein
MVNQAYIQALRHHCISSFPFKEQMTLRRFDPSSVTKRNEWNVDIANPEFVTIAKEQTCDSRVSLLGLTLQK